MFANTPFGFHFTFPNGWLISVQWGPGNYCTSRQNEAYGKVSPFDGQYHEFESNTAEVAIFHPDHNRMYPMAEHDDVVGWQTATDVVQWMLFASRLDEDYDKVMAEAPYKGLGNYEANWETNDDYRDSTIATFKIL